MKDATVSAKVDEPETADSMSDAERNAKLKHSYAQSLRGEGRPYAEVFDEIESIKEVIYMTETSVVMDRFMERLSKKENQPNNGPEISLEFIDEQLQSYSKLLKSDIIKEALGE